MRLQQTRQPHSRHTGPVEYLPAPLQRHMYYKRKGFPAKNTSVACRSNACCCSKVSPASSRLERERQRREAATASKVLFFAGMGSKGEIYLLVSAINASTVSPLARIRLRSVPGAISR